MEALSVLEKKIESLVALIQEMRKETQELRKEKDKLVEENFQLLTKIEILESSLLTDNERIEKLNQERALAKTAVDDLIRNIDLLVEEKQQ